MKYPKVTGEFRTIGALRSGKSIARFGDGELKLIHGSGYFREPPSTEMATELLEILQRPHADCLVGIPTMSRKGPKYENWIRHIDRFLKVLRPDVVDYYSAFITRPDSAPWINVIKYAAQVEEIWRRRQATVLSEPGNSILPAVSLSAKRVSHVRCPSRQAYAEIDRLEQEIVATGPEIALLSCGPTATCLAHRLAVRGIQAVDIGSAGGYLLKLLKGKK